MDNASIILSTLDRHLTTPARLILYGRAALQLGFENAPAETAKSQDVDAIIPVGDLLALTEDMQFWDAQAATNRELLPLGLYITHLFRADQVFLREGWEQYCTYISTTDNVAATFSSRHARSHSHQDDARGRSAGHGRRCLYDSA
jgi:hypothetical protein